MVSETPIYGKTTKSIYTESSGYTHKLLQFIIVQLIFEQNANGKCKLNFYVEKQAIQLKFIFLLDLFLKCLFSQGQGSVKAEAKRSSF